MNSPAVYTRLAFILFQLLDVSDLYGSLMVGIICSSNNVKKDFSDSKNIIFNVFEGALSTFQVPTPSGGFEGRR